MAISPKQQAASSGSDKCSLTRYRRREAAPPVYEKDTMMSLHGHDGAQAAFAQGFSGLAQIGPSKL
jgi:hypothetical protein